MNNWYWYWCCKSNLKILKLVLLLKKFLSILKLKSIWQNGLWKYWIAYWYWNTLKINKQLNKYCSMQVIEWILKIEIKTYSIRNNWYWNWYCRLLGGRWHGGLDGFSIRNILAEQFSNSDIIVFVTSSLLHKAPPILFHQQPSWQNALQDIEIDIEIAELHWFNWNQYWYWQIYLETLKWKLILQENFENLK